MKRLIGSLTQDQRLEVLRDLDRAAAINRDYVLLVLLSCVIATFGLIMNSGAIIIGAMLIAPLMSSILAFSLSLVRGDLLRLGRSLATLAVGVVLAVGLSALLGLMVSWGAPNFLVELPSEIVGRTAPTLFDLAVALAGGAAASYALAQPHLSATLPGVAIATALMPPLCAAGIGLSQERWNVSLGAFLLFLANLVAIVFAGCVVFAGLGFGSRLVSEHRIVVSRALIIAATMLLLVAVPLGFFMVGIIQDSQENGTIRDTLSGQLAAVGDGGELVTFEKRWEQDHLEVQATVRLSRNLAHAEVVEIQRVLATRLQKPAALKLLVVPVTKLDPLIPPTLTPTPPPNATATPTATPTPLPSATPTPRPTATPTPSPSPSRTPSLTPTPLSYAVVAGTSQGAVNLRRAPGMTAVVATLPDGTVVVLTGRRAEEGGADWVEVIAPDGLVGWVAEVYLVPYYPYAPPPTP